MRTLIYAIGWMWMYKMYKKIVKIVGNNRRDEWLGTKKKEVKKESLLVTATFSNAFASCTGKKKKLSRSSSISVCDCIL